MKLFNIELKKQLYNMFSQFGPILDVIASRSMRTRGQAWIVFDNKQTALAAKKKMDGTIFYDKPMQVQFSKAKSDAIAKLDGSIHKQKQDREEKRKHYEANKKKQQMMKSDRSLGSRDASDERPSKRMRTAAAATEPSSTGATNAAANTMMMNEPNKILFVENLPAEISGEEARQSLEDLCQSNVGFKELRLIPVKGWAFAEFESEIHAANALSQLQGFMVKNQAM